jgi:hypothetical protein
MAVPGNNLMQVEPNFYGDEETTTTQGCTAEDFLTRVMGFKDANNWTNAQTVKNAISFLRVKAHYYITETLATYNPEEHELIKGGCLKTFTQVFKEHYFKIKAVTDLSSDWAQLKQRERESPASFADRVVGTLSEYNRLLADEGELEALDQAQRDAMNAIIRAALHSVSADEIPDGLMDNLVVAMKNIRDGYKELGRSTLVKNLIYKVLSNGLRQKNMQELVRKEEYKKTGLQDIVKLLTQMHQAGTKMENAPIKNSIPNAGRVSEVSEVPEEDDYSEINAFPNFKGKSKGGQRGGRGGRGNGRGNNKGKRGKGGHTQQIHNDAEQAPVEQQFQHQGPTPAPQHNSNRGGTCRFCSQEGHWIQNCPVKQQMLASIPPPMTNPNLPVYRINLSHGGDRNTLHGSGNWHTVV